MGEFASTVNDLIDRHEERDDNMEGMKAKLADTEDRSRCNNLKIREVPEMVQQVQLCNQFI